MTEDEGLYLAFLEALLPPVMYAGDAGTAEEATTARRRLTLEAAIKAWGGFPGDPLGPGQTYRPQDLAALPFMGAMVAVQTARHRNPKRR